MGRSAEHQQVQQHILEDGGAGSTTERAEGGQLLLSCCSKLKHTIRQRDAVTNHQQLSVRSDLVHVHASGQACDHSLLDLTAARGDAV